MSTTKLVHLEGLEDGHKGLDIKVELDREHRVVTLHMREFDAALIESFLEDGGLRQFGLRIDDSLFADIITLPLFRLAIDLAGRRHPASLQYLASGRVSLRLGDPGTEYQAKCLDLEPESPAYLEQLPADAPLPTRVTMPRAHDD